MATQLPCPLEQSVGALDAFQRNGPAANRNRRLADVQRADGLCRRMGRLDIAPVGFSRRGLGQRALGRDQFRDDLMGADDLDPTRFEAARQDLQQAVVATGQRHHHGGYHSEQAEAGAHVDQSRPAPDLAGKHQMGNLLPSQH